MKTQDTLQHTTSRIAMALKLTKALQLFVLALAIVLVLPSLSFADQDLGQVEKINPNDRDESQNPDMVNYYQGNKGATWHLWKRPDGTYYLKSKTMKAEITGATVRTGLGQTYQIPDKTNNQGVDNFHRDVNSFVNKEITLLAANSPTSGASFFPLNLPTALATEGDSSGMWEDSFTKTFGVVGFERVSNDLSLLGSSTPDGGTPVVYSFDASTENWVIDAYGGSEFTFADSGITHPGGDFAVGWAFGTTPEPSALFLFGSGVLGLSCFLRKQLLTRS